MLLFIDIFRCPVCDVMCVFKSCVVVLCVVQRAVFSGTTICRRAVRCQRCGKVNRSVGVQSGRRHDGGEHGTESSARRARSSALCLWDWYCIHHRNAAVSSVSCWVFVCCFFCVFVHRFLTLIQFMVVYDVLESCGASAMCFRLVFQFFDSAGLSWEGHRNSKNFVVCCLVARQLIRKQQPVILSSGSGSSISRLVVVVVVIEGFCGRRG